MQFEVKSRTLFDFRSLNLSADELILEGQSSLKSIDSNGLFSSMRGPSINIVARHLRGDGRLDIISQGADH